MGRNSLKGTEKETEQTMFRPLKKYKELVKEKDYFEYKDLSAYMVDLFYTDLEKRGYIRRMEDESE